MFPDPQWEPDRSTGYALDRVAQLIEMWDEYRSTSYSLHRIAQVLEDFGYRFPSTDKPTMFDDLED